MSPISIPPYTPAPTIGPAIEPLRVQTRVAWGDPWLTVHYIEPIRSTDLVSPGVSSAEFRFRYGWLKREDESVLSQHYSEDLDGKYIRVQTVSTFWVPNPGGGSYVTVGTTIWVGIVAEVNFLLHRGDPTVGGQGDMKITAYGLAHILDSTPAGNDSTRVGSNMSPAAPYLSIERSLKFNDSPDLGRKSGTGTARGGNRSEAKDPSSGTPGWYVFDRDDSPTGAGGDTWTAYDIAEYLLCDDNLPFRFRLGGQASILQDIDPPTLSIEGLSVKAALDRVIDRRRGVGWCIRVVEDPADPDNEYAVVWVFSTADVPMSYASDIHPANAEQFWVDLDLEVGSGGLAILGEVVIGYGSERYDWIVVQGEPILSMFTVSITDTTLERLWTDGDETAYDALDEDARGGDAYRKVYRSYVIPDDFDFLAGNGLGSGSSPVCPKLHADGTIDDTTSTPHFTPASIRGWGHRLERQLPMQADASVEETYQAPLVWVLNPDDSKYYQVERLDVLEKPSASITMLDKHFGFHLTVSPNQVFGLNHFNDSPAVIQPTFDYDTIVATVAMRCDHRLRVYERVDPNNTDTAPTGRVLHVNVPGAELWWCVPSTVLSIGVDGLPVHSGGAASTCTLRDDSAKLRRIMAMAKVWYGRERATIQMAYSGFCSLGEPGSMIGQAASGLVTVTIGTVVTSRTRDYEHGTTEIQTNFSEMDFAGF